MKTKILFFPILLFFFINSYGQKKIAGKSLIVHQSIRTYLNSSIINELDTIYSFSTPGNNPSGICYDGSDLWHCDASMYIYKLSLSGEIIDSIPNPDINSYIRGGAMTYDGDNIWLVGEQSGKLFKIDINGDVLNEFNLPSKNHSDPNGFGIAWDGNYLWHSQYDPVKIYKIDPINGELLDSISPQDTILGIEWINDELYGIVWSEDFNNSKFVLIDTATGQLTDTINWVITDPLDLCWDHSYLWNISGAALKIYNVSLDLTPTSIESMISPNELKIYPNPFNSYITIDDESDTTNELHLMDVNGRILKTIYPSDSKENLDLSFLKNGLYIFKQKDRIIKALKVK